MYNLKLPLKGVKIIAVIAVLLCCIMALGMNAFAASAQTVELKANGSEAQLVMDFPQAAAEEISSMQISLVVSSSGGADIKFVPDSGLPAKIVESRYHSDTGVLTVYLAGTKALFSGHSSLKVGKITISGTNVAAAVGVAEDSIKFVRGSELVAPDDVEYPAVVTISTGNAPAPAPPVTSPSISSTSSTSSVPSSETTSTPTSSSDTTQPNEPNEPAFEPVEPADTSSLEETIERAEGYKRGDYTEDSYGTLTDALNKAKAVLSNAGSTQDEVDEALLILENAIGMLTSVHTAPSGTDDYGVSASDDDVSLPGGNGGNSNNPGGVSGSPLNPSIGGNGQPGDNTGNTDSNGQIIGDGQDTSDGSQPNDTSKPDSSENEDKDNTVMWIIIVMAVLVVAAGAIIAALKLTKKKK